MAKKDIRQYRQKVLESKGFLPFESQYYSQFPISQLGMRKIIRNRPPSFTEMVIYLLILSMPSCLIYYIASLIIDYTTDNAWIQTLLPTAIAISSIFLWVFIVIPLLIKGKEKWLEKT